MSKLRILELYEYLQGKVIMDPEDRGLYMQLWDCVGMALIMRMI